MAWFQVFTHFTECIAKICTSQEIVYGRRGEGGADHLHDALQHGRPGGRLPELNDEADPERHITWLMLMEMVTKILRAVTVIN